MLRFFSKREVQEIMEKVEYVSSTAGEVVRIPNKLTPDILYLTGLILGDGCLPISRRYGVNNLYYQAVITSKDKEFLAKKIAPIFKEVFEVNYISIKYYFHRGHSWNLIKRNKAIYRFFTRMIGLQRGNKSAKGEIPPIIKKMNPKESAPFIAGLVDSDIGKHASGMGSTFKSKKLVDDLIFFLNKSGIIAKHYGSHYKNNKYLQHDFTIPKSQIIKLKGLLEANYLPKRKERLETLYSLAT